MKTRRIAALIAFNASALLVVIAFIALAAWQVQRRAWKLDLIARIEARIDAAPVAAPSKDRWPEISVDKDEYRRVQVSGRWIDARAALVLAVTELGGGYWVMSPFARDDGTTVLINRGFIPGEAKERSSWTPPSQDATINGKMRLTEPRGAYLRSNDPVADRWFSRDVAAIASARGLTNVAPYFIDAEGPRMGADLPVPGLTVLSFSNNHLIYALTWAALALMTAAAAIYVDFILLAGGRRLPELTPRRTAERQRRDETAGIRG